MRHTSTPKLSSRGADLGAAGLSSFDTADTLLFLGGMAWSAVVIRRRGEFLWLLRGYTMAVCDIRRANATVVVHENSFSGTLTREHAFGGLGALRRWRSGE